MVTVQGRVLKKPAIIYQNGSVSPYIDGRARWNLRHVSQMFKSGQLEKWAILRITRDARDPKGEKSKFEETLHGFLRTLRQILGGNNVSEPVESWRKTIDKGDDAALEQDFMHCKNKGIHLLLIVLPDNDASTYKHIKKLGDIDHGINTVCVLGDSTTQKFYKTPVKNAVQYFANVALKINLKLGGINHILRDHTPLYNNTMVIGIDVTHPSPGPTKRTAPSVAAMVASVDNEVLPSHLYDSPW